MRYIFGIIAVFMVVQAWAGSTVTSRMIQKHGTQSAISSARLVYELAISTDGKELFYGYSTGKTKAVSDARFRRFSSAHILTVGPQGPQGPEGPTGATGATGATGPAGTFSRPASFTNISTVSMSALPRATFTSYTSVPRPTLSNYPPMMNGYQVAGWETTAARGDHSHPSDTGKLSTTGGTMTGPLTNSTNGAASTPVISTTGSVYTGGSGTTTMPLVLFNDGRPAYTGWSTNGTIIGVLTSKTSAYMLHLQNTSAANWSFKVDGYGFATAVAHVANGTGEASTPNFYYEQGGKRSGIFNPSNSAVAIAANSIEQARINTTGLGLGTTAPAEKLSVGDTGNVSIGNLAKVAATTNSIIGKHGVAGTAISGGSILTPVTDGFTITTAAGTQSTLGASLTTPSATIGDATNGVQLSGTDLLLTGTATGWDDLRVEPVIKSTGTNDPVFTKYMDDGAGSRGVYAYAFTDASAGNEKEVFFSFQMPHTWKEGSTVVPHIHWFPAVAGSAGNVVRWGLECSTANMGSAFPTTTTTYCETQALGTITTQYSHMLTSCGNMTMTGFTMSSVGVCRMFRNSSHANDTLGQTAGLLYIDIHYEINRPAGSKTDTAN